MNDRYLDKDKKFYNYHTEEVMGSDIFDRHKGSNSYAQDFIDDPDYMLSTYNIKMDIVELSPKEYWETCAKDVFQKPVNQLLHQWQTLDSKTIEHLKDVITVYKRKFPITYIDYARHDHPAQEGLHRMIVAGELFGWDTKFPVMIMRWADEKKAAEQKIQKRINEVERYIDRAIMRSLRYRYYNIDELKDQLYSDIMDELRYDDEFENKKFRLDISRNADQSGYDVTVNDRYHGEISDTELMVINSDTSVSDEDDSELDDDLLFDLDDDWLVSDYNI